MIEFVGIRRLGIILNFIGSVLIAISIGPIKDGGDTSNKDGNFEIAYFKPKLFYVGITIFSLGFLLQF